MFVRPNLRSRKSSLNLVGVHQISISAPHSSEWYQPPAAQQILTAWYLVRMCILVDIMVRCQIVRGLANRTQTEIVMA
jgi:hypothetical protein